MTSKEYKAEKWLDLCKVRSETHEVFLYYKGTEKETIPHVAATEPKPPQAKQSAPDYGGYASYDSYASYGGSYGYGYGYMSYADDHGSRTYTSVITSPEGDQSKIIFQQEDLEAAIWKLKQPIEIGNSMTAALFINEKNPTLMSKLFDSALPSWGRHVYKDAISFIILYDKINTSDEFAVEVANWIGALYIQPIDVSTLFVHQTAKSFLDSMASRIAVTKLKPELVKRFTLMETVRYCGLQALKQTNFEAIDPIGNSLLYLALHNPDTEVFFHIASKNPNLLNVTNKYGHSVITSIEFMKDRHYETQYFDWKRFWTLPFDFSNPNINFKGLDLPSLPLLVLELMRNKEVWAKAKDSIPERLETLQKVLQKLPHALRERYSRLDEEYPLALEVLELFLAEGITPDAKSVHKFFHNGFVNCVKYFVEKGYAIQDKDVETVFKICWEKTMAYLIETPLFTKLSTQTMAAIAHNLAKQGSNIILSKLAKKGIVLPLSANADAYLSSANIIARSNAKKNISLKHLSAIALQDNRTEIDIERVIEELPEELQNLFVNSDRHQWLLYLNNEKKKKQLLKFYEALSKADREGESMQITIDGFTFGFKYYNHYSTDSAEVWQNGLSKYSSATRYKFLRAEHAVTTGSLHVEEWTQTDEQHKEVLEKVLQAIGWDYSDAFVFFTVLFAHMIGRNEQGEDKIRCHQFVQWQAVAEFHQIPEWYSTFILEHYGIKVGPKPHVFYS